MHFKRAVARLGIAGLAAVHTPRNIDHMAFALSANERGDPTVAHEHHVLNIVFANVGCYPGVINGRNTNNPKVCTLLKESRTDDENARSRSCLYSGQ